MQLNKEYWMVVRSKTTGKFKNALMTDNANIIEVVTAKFETENPDYQVIHIGEGNLPPKTYQSLEYVN
jgi:hypothetical protein